MGVKINLFFIDQKAKKSKKVGKKSKKDKSKLLVDIWNFILIELDHIDEEDEDKSMISN